MKKKLTTKQFAIIQYLVYISFTGGMISQVIHTITVYQSLAHGESIVYALFFAISFDLFVGIAIMIGWKLPALMASAAMVAINLICYHVAFGITLPCLTACLLSLVQPAMIYAYATLIHNLDEPYQKPGPKAGTKQKATKKDEDND
jgi:hypothetical protein